MFFNIRQYVNESAEEYITRMQQKVCDEEIPTRMLIKLIDRWLKQDVEDKNLDKEPKTMEDLMKFSKMAKSNLRSTKGKDVNIITSIENMKESLLTKLPVNFSLLWQYRLNKQTYPAKKKRKFLFYSPNGPYKELLGRPLKTSFLNISKTIENFWTHVEQNKLRIESTDIQKKGLDP